MVTLKYAEQVHDMFDLDKYLLPLYRKNDEYHDVDWYIRDKPFKE